MGIYFKSIKLLIEVEKKHGWEKLILLLQHEIILKLMQIGNSYLRLNSIEILFARPWNPENVYSVIFWRDKRRYIFKILILSSLPLDSIQLVRKVWKHFYINTRRNLSEKRSNTSFLGTFPKKMYFQNIGYLKKKHIPHDILK